MDNCWRIHASATQRADLYSAAPGNLWVIKEVAGVQRRQEIHLSACGRDQDGYIRFCRPDPVEAIQYFMDSRGVDRRDLDRYIGPSGRVSEDLNRKHPLTLSMIRRLNTGLGIPAEVLIHRSTSS